MGERQCSCDRTGLILRGAARTATSRAGAFDSTPAAPDRRDTGNGLGYKARTVFNHMSATRRDSARCGGVSLVTIGQSVVLIWRPLAQVWDHLPSAPGMAPVS